MYFLKSALNYGIFKTHEDLFEGKNVGPYLATLFHKFWATKTHFSIVRHKKHLFCSENPKKSKY
jgi:hypothetical protein